VVKTKKGLGLTVIPRGINLYTRFAARASDRQGLILWGLKSIISSSPIPDYALSYVQNGFTFSRVYQHLLTASLSCTTRAINRLCCRAILLPYVQVLPRRSPSALRTRPLQLSKVTFLQLQSFLDTLEAWQVFHLWSRTVKLRNRSIAQLDRAWTRAVNSPTWWYRLHTWRGWQEGVSERRES
jgi:hypothetical protein